MSSSLHIDNKKKDILVLGKGPMQGLDHVTGKQIIWKRLDLIVMFMI